MSCALEAPIACPTNNCPNNGPEPQSTFTRYQEYLEVIKPDGCLKSTGRGDAAENDSEYLVCDECGFEGSVHEFQEAAELAELGT